MKVNSQLTSVRNVLVPMNPCEKEPIKNKKKNLINSVFNAVSFLHLLILLLIFVVGGSERSPVAGPAGEVEQDQARR